MGSRSPSHAHCDAAWSELENISEHIEILSEKVLRQIAKGLLARFTRSCEDEKKVARVWQNLLNTYSTPSISHSHMTAASNAVAIFLDCGIVSDHKGTRQLACSVETWLAVFDIYMNRFDEAKFKSMMQIVHSLINVLNHDEDNMLRIRSQAIDTFIRSIILRGTRSQLKASMLSIEVFLRKNVIRPMELIALIEIWLMKNTRKWVPILQQDCNALSINVSQFSSRPNDDCSCACAVEATAAIFSLALVSLGRHQDFASAVGSTMAAVFQGTHTSSHDGKVEIQNLSSAWVTPVKQVVLRSMDSLETISNQVIYPLCKTDPHGFRHFVDNLPLSAILTGDANSVPSRELFLLFSVLRIGKKLGLVHEDYFTSNSSSPYAEFGNLLILKSEVIGRYLQHSKSNLRLEALSLLVTASATTRPLTSAAARVIIKGLPSMHAGSDAYSRGEILSLTRKFITRVKGGILEDQSKLTQIAGLSQATETRALIDAYISFLKADLRPGASYPRHITALKALTLVLESGLDQRIGSAYPRNKPGENNQCKLSIDLLNSDLIRSLVDLLLDAFDDVRATSLAILEMFPREILMGCEFQTKERPLQSSSRLTDALLRAEQLASNTSRADHADAVARLYYILFSTASVTCRDKQEAGWWETKAGVVHTILEKLEDKLSLPGALFTSSMRNVPLHGLLSTLRYIIMVPAFYSSTPDQQSVGRSRWRHFHDRITSVCDKIWQEVQSVLCVDSPEGYQDGSAEDLAIGPKDILSYSWRALRESSLLLHAVLTNVTYGPKGDDGLNRADYERIGVLSFIQLAELRHRGAFSTVAQTFETCCQRCGQSKDLSISSLPEAWYEEVRKLIFEAASKLTRRSAGIPALVTGILSSQPGGSLFYHVMNDLHGISSLPEHLEKTKQEMELPQVHAMNCLKDIFHNNKMGRHSEPFVMNALTIAAERLGSSVWALRNSGLMLFRALMTRMFRLIPGARLGFGGESGAEPGARITFGKYPGLLQLLSSLLEPSEGDSKTKSLASTWDTERVFPALELIGEKVPTPWNDDDSLLRRLVLYQLKSPVWGIREHAARVYASLLNRADIPQGIQELLASDQGDATQNHLHGKALGLRYTLRRYELAMEMDWNEYMDEMSSVVQRAFTCILPSANSPFVAATLVETLCDLAQRGIEAGLEEKTSLLLNEIFDMYDLDGIWGYIFDRSNLCWKYLGTSRATSLLRRQLSWCVMLRKLTSNHFDELESIFQDVSDFDSDAGQWLLEKMLSAFRQNDQYILPLAGLCSSVALGRHNQRVKLAAIENLAKFLESLPDNYQSGISKINLPYESLERELRADADLYVRNRDMAGAALRLQSCLLSLRTSSTRPPSMSEIKKDISEWVVKVQFALEEEMEPATRYAAATSLATFARRLRPADGVAKTDEAFLDIYLNIYDMLNDDDVEIRDLTACTASWILSYSSVSPGEAVSVDCLNASKLLATFISKSYSSSRYLCDKIVRYIAGQRPRLTGPLPCEKAVAVSKLISEFRKESTVLFVEEKQNLFIDEIRELNQWTKALFGLAESAYDSSSVMEIFEWTAEGLSCMCELADGNAETDGLLGWTSKPDIFTLGMRVISIAITLNSERFPASGQIGQRQKDILEEGLKTLIHRGHGAALHPDWLRRAQVGLDTYDLELIETGAR